MKILAIGAHPDDIEFGAGGLLVKEAKKGSKIKYLVCSLGESGTNGTPEERKQEAEAAAKVIDASIEFLDLGGDCKIEDSPINRIKIAKAIREFKPDILLAPEMEQNQHPDHYSVSKIAQKASRLARYGGLTEIKDLPTHKISSLFYFPSRAEITSQPDILIDISQEYEKWMEAVNCHKSQMQTKAYVNLVSTKAAAWGAAIGVKYAAALWTNDPIKIEDFSSIDSSRNY